MPPEFTRTDAKAQACSYLLLGLLQRMDQKELGLIEEMLAGVQGDFEASQAQTDVAAAIPMIYEEALALLTRANGYKRNMSAGT